MWIDFVLPTLKGGIKQNLKAIVLIPKGIK